MLPPALLKLLTLSLLLAGWLLVHGILVARAEDGHIARRFLVPIRFRSPAIAAFSCLWMLLALSYALLWCVPAAFYP